MKSKLAIGFIVFATALIVPTSAWAAVTFEPAVHYATGDGSRSVATGDLNGDGDLDLAVANQFANNVSILLGDGGGTFTPALSPGVDNNPVSVAVGDLDGDGDLDLATANLLGHTASVLLGNGDGTFDTAVNYSTGGGPRSVAIGDLDEDGDLDLATANSSSDNVSILLGTGTGAFGPAVHYPVGSSPASVGIGDLDGDTKPDLAVANRASASVSILLGTGAGAFAPGGDYPTSSGPLSVAIGDLDGDSNPDLAFANDFSGNISILLGNGDGTFNPAVHHATGDVPVEVAIGDLDGDTKPDLAVANNSSGNVSVLLQSKPTFATGPAASISGTVRQGQTLTAGEGSPDPVPDSFAYEWFGDGATIAGQTAKTLALGPGTVGKKISVTVTAKKAGLTDASDTSPETVPVVGIFTPGPKASLSGKPRIGSALIAHVGSPSPAATSYAYRWYANGKLLPNKTRWLKLTTAHYYKRIQVKVWAAKAGYRTATSLSAPTTPINNLQAKTISMELNDYTVWRTQRVYAEIERLAPREPFSIVLDGKKLAAGKANTKGVAVVGFTVPANATGGTRIIRAHGQYPDRTDPDRITIR